MDALDTLLAKITAQDPVLASMSVVAVASQKKGKKAPIVDPRLEADRFAGTQALLASLVALGEQSRVETSNAIAALRNWLVGCKLQEILHPQLTANEDIPDDPIFPCTPSCKRFVGVLGKPNQLQQLCNSLGQQALELTKQMGSEQVLIAKVRRLGAASRSVTDQQQRVKVDGQWHWVEAPPHVRTSQEVPSIFLPLPNLTGELFQAALDRNESYSLSLKNCATHISKLSYDELQTRFSDTKNSTGRRRGNKKREISYGGAEFDFSRGESNNEMMLVNRPFHIQLFCVLARYSSFSVGDDSPDFHPALHPSTLAALRGSLGRCVEWCVSPMSAQCKTYWSFFPDTDAVFGSQGHFLQANPPLVWGRGKVIVAFPPAVPDLLVALPDAIIHALSFPGDFAGPLYAAVFISLASSDKDKQVSAAAEAACSKLEKSKFFTLKKRFKAGAHGFRRGRAWAHPASSQFTTSPHDTQFYLLCRQDENENGRDAAIDFKQLLANVTQSMQSNEHRERQHVAKQMRYNDRGLQSLGWRKRSSLTNPHREEEDDDE